MLTRVYIDNFLCFVKFEYRPDKKQLILGGNGSGKSSFFDAIISIQHFAIHGDKLENNFPYHIQTRWLDQVNQAFELEAQLDSRKYVYKLELSAIGKRTRPYVLSETVHCDNKPIFEFQKGEVQLYNNEFERTITYPFDSKRSAFETISEQKDNSALIRFKNWFAGISCFRINPYKMGISAKEAAAVAAVPDFDLFNFAEWYFGLQQNDPQQNLAMFESLKDSLDGFSSLEFTEGLDNDRPLKVNFEGILRGKLSFGFNDLSEGQRCLICLYAILHFVIAKGYTVILDEPDNFVSLREIQPWLTAVSDAIEDGNGQVLLISHHPELIDQWAPENGVRFVRDGIGPVRVEKFQGDPESGLSPSELVARGWDA